jgi:hypothetical protein
VFSSGEAIMAESNYTKEMQLQTVRQKLNADKIKLWLPPYTAADSNEGHIPEVSLNLFADYYSNIHYPTFVLSLI